MLPFIAGFFGVNPTLGVLISALVFFILLVRCKLKSIPRAIVSVIVFPITLMIALAVLTMFHPNADSVRPQHVEWAKR